MNFLTLLFASNNQHKAGEIRSVLGDQFRIQTLKEAGIDIDIPEPHATLEANAREKSMRIFEIAGVDCFSEDSGLEVGALGGEPGVRSARYAEGTPFADNTERLLAEMQQAVNRTARFRTVISLIYKGEEHIFEGVCEGSIAESPAGENGFGYDPVFIPAGSDRTFAQMTMEEKNGFSHRKKATALLVDYLQNLHVQS